MLRFIFNSLKEGTVFEKILGVLAVIVAVIFVLAIIAISISIPALIGMLLWNFIIKYFEYPWGLKEVNFEVALAIYILLSILGGIFKARIKVDK